MTLKYTIERPIFRPQDQDEQACCYSGKKAAYCEESAAAQLGARRSSTPQYEYLVINALEAHLTTVVERKRRFGRLKRCLA